MLNEAVDSFDRLEKLKKNGKGNYIDYKLERIKDIKLKEEIDKIKKELKKLNKKR